LTPYYSDHHYTATLRYTSTHFTQLHFTTLIDALLYRRFKELIFNTLLFADDQLIIADTEGNLQEAGYLVYSISKKYNLEIATGKTKVFGFVGTDHLRTKIIIKDETLDQVSPCTYLGCSISY
jgi:hypothetical protein